jgi:CRP-like cAMP-binding protein
MPTIERIDFRDFARSVGTVVRYAAGDAIFREGDAAGLMYVILRGSVELTKQRRMIETMHGGDAFGFVSFLDGEPRGVAATAADACDLALIDQRKFRYMVEEMPNFVWYVMDQMARHLRIASAAL